MALRAVPKGGREAGPEPVSERAGAPFDRGVGFNHLTGQLTHHIAPDIDAERDTLIAALTGAGQVARIYRVSGVGPT